MGKGQRLALGHVGSDLLVVDIGAQLIGNQHHNDVAGLGGLLYFHHMEVGAGLGKLAGLLPVGGTLPQTHHHVDAGLGQVFGMGVALRAKADDGDGFAVQNAEVAVRIVILVDRHDFFSFFFPLMFVQV